MAALVILLVCRFHHHESRGAGQGPSLPPPLSDSVAAVQSNGNHHLPHFLDMEMIGSYRDQVSHRTQHVFGSVSNIFRVS